MIIRNGVYKMFPDEERGLLYCVDERVFVVDLNTGEKICSLKPVPYMNQTLFDEKSGCIIFKSTVGHFAVFKSGEFSEPIWKFKLKVSNTDMDFVLHENKLFGEATSDGGGSGEYFQFKYFMIDLNTRVITYSLEYQGGDERLDKSVIEERGRLIIKYKARDKARGEVYGDISDKVKQILKSNLSPIDRIIPKEYTASAEKYRLLESEYRAIKDESEENRAKYYQYLIKELQCRVTDYYENDKFEFVAYGDRLMVVSKATKKEQPDATDNEQVESYNCETYFCENGLTQQGLEAFAPEEVIHGGYFWALNNIEIRAKEKGISLHSFLDNSEDINDEEHILYSIGWLQAEIDNGGISQYFTNGDTTEFARLIKAFTLIGASETVKIIKRGAKLISDYKTKDDKSNWAYEKFHEKFDNLLAKLDTEDYEGMAVKYLMERLK